MTIADQIQEDIAALTHRTESTADILAGWVDHIREELDRTDDENVEAECTLALTGNRECLARVLQRLSEQPFASLEAQ